MDFVLTAVMKDENYLYKGLCNRSIVIYKLNCVTTGKSYIVNIQIYLEKRMQQHLGDVWKVIESGNKKFGPKWCGTGGFTGADAFEKHFRNICRECKSSNHVRAKMKNMVPSILW